MLKNLPTDYLKRLKKYQYDIKYYHYETISHN